MVPLERLFPFLTSELDEEVLSKETPTKFKVKKNIRTTLSTRFVFGI